jgi:signal transduction histidine kinase
VNQESIRLDTLLRERLTHFAELMELKALQVSTEIGEQITLLINPLLAEILLDNLISNAIKYNFSGGTLSVRLTDRLLTIRNQGEAPRGPTAAFFDRFVKADPRSRSLGLGLAIVKAICETNGLEIAYGFSDGFHRIDVSFPVREPAGVYPVKFRSALSP